MAGHKSHLRKQITDQIAEPVAPFEENIAQALKQEGQFDGHLSGDQLSVIMRKVLYTLVAEQRFAGFDVPIVHNVTAMEVRIARREARVFAEVHVHSPITAFIQFRYTLQNDPRHPGHKLQLKNRQVEVKETTRPFDLAARAALAILSVRQIALRELSDPNAVIQRTLPPQLARLGFQRPLAQIALELEDSAMRVFIAAGSLDGASG